MADYNINEIAGSLALVLGSIGGLCLIMFKSRCESISICWGVWECSRKVAEEEQQPDEEVGDQKTEAILPSERTTPVVAPPVAPPVVAPVVAP